MKSAFNTPLASNHLPAGLDSLIEPAGEIWSVVIESPNTPSARAFAIPVAAALGSIAKSWKKGGSAMYVDLGQL